MNDYNCLMLYCKQPQIVKKLHEQIDKDDLYTEEEGYGFEKESHITVLYGLKPEVKWDDLKKYLEPIDKFNIISPKISAFENDKYDVLKLDIKCPLLHTINKRLTDNLPYETDYPNYQPHMTIAYLKKNCAEKYIKTMLDKIEKIYPREYVYSKTNGEKEKHQTLNERKTFSQWKESIKNENQLLSHKKEFSKLLHEFEDTMTTFCYGFDKKLEKQDKLYEGLIKTYSVQDTLSQLDGTGLDYKLIKTNNTNRFGINVIGEDNIVLLKNFMNTYGWLLSFQKNRGDNTYFLEFVAKFDSELDLINRPKFLYHLTPISKLDKILKNGLSPRAENKKANLNDRIYFLKQNKHLLTEHLLSQLFKANKQNFEYKYKYYLLEVNILPINDELRIRLFNDPHMINAVYTMDNISPQHLKVVEEFELDVNGNIIKHKKIN